MNRDMYFENLTLADGVTLNPNGYRLFVRGILVLGDEAAISRDGETGRSELTPGVGLQDGTLGSSGRNGGGSPRDGGSSRNSLGGDGGDSAEGCAGGCGGTAEAIPVKSGGPNPWRTAITAVTGKDLAGVKVNGGAGGGATGSGGTGGVGGGVVVLVAHTISVPNGAAIISANGGDGMSTEPGHGGGGGGGGGGVAVVVSTHAKPSNLNVAAEGGTGGLNKNTGARGGDGEDGTVLWFSTTN